MFSHHSKKSTFDVIEIYMPFNKTSDIPSFPNITLSLFQALFVTGRRWYDRWLMSQRPGKFRIAFMKIFLSKGSSFGLLVVYYVFLKYSEANWKTGQRSKMEAFAKIFDILKPVTIFAKIFILNILLGSKYTSNSNDKNIIMILSHSDRDGIWTHNHLIRKRTLNHLAKLA